MVIKLNVRKIFTGLTTNADALSTWLANLHVIMLFGHFTTSVDIL